MSRASYDHRRAGKGPGGLYRDRENGWIFGVCAGLADYAGVRPAVVRVFALIGLLLFFWATVIAYGVAALLFRQKPLTWSGRCHESEFWRRHRATDRWSHS